LSKLFSLFSNKHAWLAFIAGLAMTFSYAPFNLWPIAIFSLITACYVTDKQSTRSAAKYGFAFGFGWFALGISWVHVSIAQFGGLPLPVSLLLMGLLCAYLAIYPALAFAFAARFSQSAWQRIALLVVGFAITEFLRGMLLTGFPWLSFGYAFTDSPLNIFAPLIGEFGLTLMAVFIASSIYYSIKAKHVSFSLSALVALLCLYLTSSLTVSTSYSDKRISTLLVQGNIQQSLRWEPEQFWPTMSKYRDMTRVEWSETDLVVWPEAAIPEIEDMAAPFLEGLDKAAAFNNTAVITGIPDYQFDTKAVYNTLIVLGKKYPDSSEGHYNYLHSNRYQKHQLLPIGEFVPFEDILRPLAPLFNLAMSSFSRGERVQNNLIANGLHILPAICYEIVFSSLVRDNFTEQSDLLFTVSNDAWFGDSHGPHQHMQIARMRALELQRPLIRVTNNGITGVYDPISQTEQTIPQFEANVLKAKVQLINGFSPFSKYGHLPIWLVVLLLTICIFAKQTKSKLLQKFERNFL
jgi:apolipoprotein N-acyltransferase